MKYIIIISQNRILENKNIKLNTQQISVSKTISIPNQLDYFLKNSTPRTNGVQQRKLFWNSFPRSPYRNGGGGDQRREMSQTISKFLCKLFCADRFRVNERMFPSKHA